MKKLWNYLTKRLQKPTTTTEVSSTMAPKIIIEGDPIQVLEETVLRMLKAGLYTFDRPVRPSIAFTLRIHNPRLKISISRWIATITDQETFYTIYVSSKGSPEHRFYCGTEFTKTYEDIAIRKNQEDMMIYNEQARRIQERIKEEAREILTQAYG